MIIKNITLLEKKEYSKYKSLIPVKDRYWWLKTSYSMTMFSVFAVDNTGNLYNAVCYTAKLDVRPLCVFEFSSDDPIFWSKHNKLIGTSMKFGNYSWTILDIKGNEIYALCEQILAKRIFSTGSNEWETSELKAWLEAEGLNLILE
jgi:hypothetical protein